MPNGDRLPDEQLQCVADWIYLMQKLLGVELCSGSQMPKAGQGLPGAQLEVVSTWICQGAQRN